MASTPYYIPSRLRTHPPGVTRRQLQFEVLTATPHTAGDSATQREKALEVRSSELLNDPKRLNALVKSIKAKLCSRGETVDEWRFSGDEQDARSLLDSLVEELTSKLTALDPLFAEAFKLSDVTAAVGPSSNKLLFELLEYLCCGPALASVRHSHRYFPHDGKVALTSLVRDVLPSVEDFSKADFVFTKSAVELTAGVNPKQFLQTFQDCLQGAQEELGDGSTLELGRDTAIRLLLRRACPTFYKAVHDEYLPEKVKAKPELTVVSCALAIQRVYNTSVKPATARPAAALGYTPSGPRPGGGRGGQYAKGGYRSSQSRYYPPRSSHPLKGKGKNYRFAAPPLPKGGNWSQSKGRKGGKSAPRKGKGKSRVTFHPGARRFFSNCSCGGRHSAVDCPRTQHLAAHSMGIDPEELADSAYSDVLAAQYQAAYEHSEEAFEAVCRDHGTPDVCDAAEALCTYPEDGSLSFSAFLAQGGTSADEQETPPWEQEWTDEEWAEWDALTAEQQEEWERLQEEASASFSSFCSQTDALSFGKVHFGSYRVGGVTGTAAAGFAACDVPCSTTTTMPLSAASAPVHSSDLSAFYPTASASSMDLSAFYPTAQSSTGGVAQSQSHSAPLQVATVGPQPTVSHSAARVSADSDTPPAPHAAHGMASPASAQTGMDTCIYPVSATRMHEPCLEPSSRLFADLVLADGPGLHGFFPEQQLCTATLSPQEQSELDRVWSEDHRVPTQWHGPPPDTVVHTPSATADATVAESVPGGPANASGLTTAVTTEDSAPAPAGAGQQVVTRPAGGTPPSASRRAGRGGVSFSRMAFFPAFLVTCFLAVVTGDVSSCDTAGTTGSVLTLFDAGDMQDGTPLAAVIGGAADGGTGSGGAGYGYCSRPGPDSGASGSGRQEDTGSYFSDFTRLGRPPDTVQQMQLLQTVYTAQQEQRKRRHPAWTVLLLAIALCIILQCMYLAFLHAVPPTLDSGTHWPSTGSGQRWHSPGGVAQATEVMSAGMVAVGRSLIGYSWWLGYRWLTHGPPPVGLVFTCDPVVSAHALSDGGDGIVVDSGATGNITGSPHRISDLDRSSTVMFSTVMSGPAARTDGLCTLRLYGRDIESGEVDEYPLPGCHFKEGARTLLSTRVMLRHGFSSPDFITMTYTHIASGRTYRILDDQVDYLWEEPTGFHRFSSSALRSRTGDSSDWMWSRSEYTAWAITHGSPEATRELGTPAFDVSMFGDSLPVGEGNNHPALEHWHRLDDAFKKHWSGRYFYGNVPFGISMVDRLLTKGNQDFLADPQNTVYFWIVPYMPNHQIWHKTCTMQVLKVYPKGTKRLFSFLQKHTYTSSHPLTPAGEDGGPGRVFIDGTPFDICILYRDRYTPVTVSPFVEFHAVMGHGSTASCLQLFDMPGVDLGRPRLSRRAIAAMPRCSQFCGVCCRTKLKQRPAGRHDEFRTLDIQPARIWQADMTGPITPVGCNGHLYRCHFIDLHSRFLFVYTITAKSEYYTCLVQFVGSVRSMGYTVESLIVHTDCAPEMGDAQCTAFFSQHGIKHRRSSPTVHTDNAYVENVTGKLSATIRALLLAAGMSDDYWPLAATHAGFVWNLSPHKPITTTPFHLLIGRHYPYGLLKVFGQHCYVVMDRQQRDRRQPGISGKLQRTAWPGRFVGISVGSRAYKILDPTTNVVHYVGKPHWIHSYTDLGVALRNFPDPKAAERAYDRTLVRPEPFDDSVDTAGLIVTGIGSYFDGEESQACVQLTASDGSMCWTTAVRFILATADGSHYRQLIHYLERYRTLNAVNEHYPIWTMVKARQSVRDPVYSAILISTHRGHTRPYGVVLEPCPSEPAGWHIDLPAKLVIFPSTHSAAYLPFSDSYTCDVRADYMFGSYSTVDEFLRDGPLDTLTHIFEVSAPGVTLPHGVRQALSSPQAEEWKAAMDKEVGDLVRQGKIELAHMPEGTAFQVTLFVLSRPFKPDPDTRIPYQIYKARMAGDGRRDYGYMHWETSSSTPEISDFRLLFIFAGLFHLDVSHLDVSQAFLHAKLSAPVWIQLPSGYSYQGYTHVRLHYALYGLRIAGASWQRLVTAFMLSFRYQGVGFQRSSHDECVYFIYTSSIKCMCVVHVDDFALAAPSDLERAFWSEFSTEFQAKHLGTVSSILQMVVQHDEHGVYLNQSRQIQDLIQAHNIPQRTVHTPMDSTLVLSKPSTPDTTLEKRYRSILGSLLWVARCSRPDCYYAVIYLSQFVSCPSDASMKALIRIAQYMDCTVHYRLAFRYPVRPPRVLTLFVYSDADMARDLQNTAKSYSGMVMFFCGMLLHYGTVRQAVTETSSTGSEYIAASTAAQRACSVMFMLSEMFGYVQHAVSDIQPVTAPLDSEVAYIERIATDISFDYPGLRSTALLAKLLDYSTPRGYGVGGVRSDAPSVTDDLRAYIDGHGRPVDYQNSRHSRYQSVSADCPRLELPIPLLLDNDACRTISENTILSQKVKHVLVRYHMLRDFIKLGWIICYRVASEDNLADPYTKPVPNIKNSKPYFNMLFEAYMDMRAATLQAARQFGFQQYSTQKAAA